MDEVTEYFCTCVLYLQASTLTIGPLKYFPCWEMQSCMSSGPQMHIFSAAICRLFTLFTSKNYVPLQNKPISCYFFFGQNMVCRFRSPVISIYDKTKRVSP